MNTETTYIVGLALSVIIAASFQLYRDSARIREEQRRRFQLHDVIGNHSKAICLAAEENAILKSDRLYSVISDGDIVHKTDDANIDLENFSGTQVQLVRNVYVTIREINREEREDEEEETDQNS